MTKDISLDEFDLSLLKGGPLYALLVRAGIARPGLRGIVFRILFTVGITWIPLALLTLGQGNFVNSALKVPFLFDFSETCRFLFVVPTLIIAESIVEPWLAHVIAHCRRLVSEADTDKFKKIIASSVRSRDSLMVEGMLLLLAFVRPHFGDFDTTNAANIGSWQTLTTAAGTVPTAALVWYLYVAKPVVALIWFRWIWKYLIWCWFLLRTSTLALRVIPTHPDGMGGLGFIADGQGRFAVLSLAFAAQSASNMDEAIVYSGATLMSFRYVILGVVALGLFLFLTPCLAFTPKLLAAKKKGLLEYGALADQYTHTFHQKWIEGQRDDKEALLGNNDIQSLADLSTSFAIVRSMRPVVVSKSTVMTFVIAALLPFLPLLLTVYPADVLIKRLWKILL